MAVYNHYKRISHASLPKGLVDIAIFFIVGGMRIGKINFMLLEGNLMPCLLKVLLLMINHWIPGLINPSIS